MENENYFKLFEIHNNSPKYSVFVPFTRPWIVKRWFKNFDGMEIDRKNSELVIYVDSDNRVMLKDITERVKDQWAMVRIYFSNLKPPRERGDKTRRSRHILMRSTSQKLLGETEFMLGLEDDTLPPAEAFPKLLETIQGDGIGFVQGTEMDRWGIGCLGACRLIWNNDRFIYLETFPYQEQGLIEIDGGGHYCFMMPTKLYKEIPFKRPRGFITNIDLYHIYRIKEKGLKVLNDFSIKCMHCSQSQVLYPTAKNVPILKRWQIKNGNLGESIIQPNGTKKKLKGGKMDIGNLVSVEVLRSVYENHKRYKPGKKKGDKGDRFLCDKKRAIQLGGCVRILKEIHDPVMKDFIAPHNTMIGFSPVRKKEEEVKDIPMKPEYICSVCGRIFDSRRALDGHLIYYANSETHKKRE